MQALRKTSDGFSLAAPAPGSGSAGPRAASDEAAAQSPARLLRDQLAARLDELAVGDAAVLAEPDGYRLPIAARLTTIVGLSLALWVGLYFTVAALL